GLPEPEHVPHDRLGRHVLPVHHLAQEPVLAVVQELDLALGVALQAHAVVLAADGQQAVALSAHRAAEAALPDRVHFLILRALGGFFKSSSSRSFMYVPWTASASIFSGVQPPQFSGAES